MGKIRKLKINALYVPTCNHSLLKPHSITEKYPDETISFVTNSIQLSGSINDPERGPILVELSNTDNLSFTRCLGNRCLIKGGMSLHSTITSVHESNLNPILVTHFGNRSSCEDIISLSYHVIAL